MDIGHTIVAYLLACAFLFFFGATIGSFLNVVIYRMPAGLNLVKPASRCPICEHPIRAYDNIPVLGWLLLRGRCRDCGVRIPLRYPMVELAVGLMFLALGGWELLTGGVNLPPASARRFDVDPLFWYASWPITGIYIYHCFWLCCLLAASLMRFDGHPLPRRFVFVALAVGLAAPLLGPELRPVHFYYPWNSAVHANVATALADGVIGMTLGWFVSRILAGSLGKISEDQSCAEGFIENVATTEGWETDGRDCVFLLATVGVYLGWQTLPAMSVAYAVIWLAFRSVGAPRRLPALLLASAVAAVHLAAWKCLWQIPYWPGSSESPWPYAVSVLFFGTCTLLLRRGAANRPVAVQAGFHTKTCHTDRLRREEADE